VKSLQTKARRRVGTRGAAGSSARKANTKRATKVGTASAAPNSGAPGPETGAPPSPADWAAVALWVSRLQALAVMVDAGPRDLNGLVLWGSWTADIRAAAAPLVSK